MKIRNLERIKKLVTLISILATISTLLFAILFWFLENNVLIYASIIAVIYFSFTFYLNKKGKTILSRILVFEGTLAIVFTYCVYTPRNSGFDLLFLLLIAAAFSFHDFKEIKLTLTHTLVAIFIFIFLKLYFKQVTLATFQEGNWRFALFIFSFIVLTIIFYNIQKVTYTIENNLIQSEDRYYKMVNTVSDYAILLIDDKGFVKNWNKGAEKIKGYTEKEIIGKNFNIFYTDKDKEEKRPEHLLNIAKKEGKALDEGWRVKKGGILFWASVSITPVYDDQQNIIGFTKVIRDLTEKKANEEKIQTYLLKLEAQNKELEQFTYITSHDLQEPLRTLTSLIEIITQDDTIQLNETVLESFKYMKQASIRMEELITALLTYCRLIQNTEVEEVNLFTLVTDVLADLNAAVKNSKAEIKVDKLPTIHGHKIQLRLLLQNLISNAIKFKKSNINPIIHIGAKELDNYWQIFVQDNGIGLDLKYKEKIFVIFQRLHLKNEYEGTGIGLAHCKKVVELHGGKIWVESIINNGSIFYFTLSK